MSDVITDLGAWDGEAPLLLTLPLPPARGNARWHWRTENRKKHDYYDLCLATVKTKRPRRPYNKVRISVAAYTWNIMDRDGLYSRFKWPLDWLVLRGYIADDSPTVLHDWGYVTQKIDRKNQRIEIELEELQ